MFEAVELGRKIPKREFEKRLPELRARLVQAEFALKQAKIPVIIILSGEDKKFARIQILKTLCEHLEEAL